MPWNDRSIHQLDEYESSMGDLQALLDSHRGCMFVIGLVVTGMLTKMVVMLLGRVCNVSAR